VFVSFPGSDEALQNPTAHPAARKPNSLAVIPSYGAVVDYFRDRYLDFLAVMSGAFG
jgi:hypothetical protein